MRANITAPEVLFGGAHDGADELDGRPAGPAIDLYSLGVTWYWLLAGRHPYFPHGHPVVLNAAEYAARPEAPAALNPTLDARWDAALLGLIDRDAASRLETARRIVDRPDRALPV